MRPTSFVLGLALCAACSTSPNPSTPDGSTDPGHDPVTDPGTDPGDHPSTWTGTTESDQQAPLGAPTVVRPALPLSGEATEGSPMVLDPAGDVAFVGDLDLGAILRFDLAAGTHTVTPIGAEPTRLLRVGDALLVTLRGTGELVRLDVSGPTPVEVDRVAVGAEPTDLVISSDLQRLYVALSQEDAVLALDAATLAPIGRFSVLGEPKWLALRGDGADERLVVASARLARLREIVPATGALATVALPVVPRFTDPDCTPRDLDARVTGDPTVDADGVLLVPMLLVDRQIEEAEPGELPAPPMAVDSGGDTGSHDIPGVCQEAFPPRGGGAYGKPADPIAPGKPGRFTPAIGVFTPGVGAPTVLAVGTPLANVTDRGQVLRSYPSSVVASGSDLFVTSPGSGAVAVVHRDLPSQEDAGRLTAVKREAVTQAAGLDAVQVAPDGRVVTWAFLDRDVHVRPTADLSGTARKLEGPASPLDPDLAVGRRLFYSAMSPQMSAAGSGVSCETCHAEGRSSSVTFVFPDMPRQPPSLAGHVSDTTPITWLGTVATVVDEVNATSRDRMGGSGLAADQARAVAAFVDSIRLPIRPVQAADAVARGAAIFARADVGCATCHAGEAHTDGQNWQVLGAEIALNTPSLRGIGSSAPYFHDGSALTLRDVLERVRDGSMGHTGALTDAELGDLEAYLRSL